MVRQKRVFVAFQIKEKHEKCATKEILEEQKSVRWTGIQNERQSCNPDHIWILKSFLYQTTGS